MNVRSIGVALAVLSLVGCRDLLDQLAKKGDAGSTVTSAEPPPTAATATDPATPPGTTNAPIGKSPTTARTAAAASPVELEKAFAALDINADNQLDGIEVKNCGCAIADANGDGEITKAEYLAAGLLGKFRPGAIPTSTARTTPTNAQTNTPTQPTPPPPAPVAGGLPPGSYNCFGLVGSMYAARGTLVIVDGQRYAHGTDGSGGGNYVFDPATKNIRFTSGLFADPNSVKSAKQMSPTHIQMQTGKGGFYTRDCKR